VSSPHGRDAPNFAQIARPISNSELLTCSEIQDGGRHHLGFSGNAKMRKWKMQEWKMPVAYFQSPLFKSCKFGTFRHVNSVGLELYIKLGSNMCYSH